MSSAKPNHISYLQSLDIPFQVPNRGPCNAKITCEPDDDPVRHGQHLVGLYKDCSIVKGYPILTAAVSSPESKTYAAIYGWIQITNTPGEPWVMDIFPVFDGVNLPFAAWGGEPTLVDAPGRQGVKDYDWVARTFLTYSPDAAMTKHVVPILAVEWGWWIDEYQPYVKKMQQLNLSIWDEHRELFQTSFPGWTFDGAGVDNA